MDDCAPSASLCQAPFDDIRPQANEAAVGHNQMSRNMYTGAERHIVF